MEAELIPFAAIPWRLIGIAAAALALAGALWWIGHRIRLSYEVDQARAEKAEAIAQHATYKAAVERQARLDAIQQARDQARDQLLAARAEALTAENETLRGIVARLSSTVERTDAHGNRSVAINPDWLLCAVSAPLGRDPADIAACEARAGDAGLPAAERH